MRLLRRASHRLAVWLGLAEDIDLDVPEWLTETQQTTALERGIAELEAWANHPANWRRP